MHPFPHLYHATVKSLASGETSELSSPGLSTQTVAPPLEFGGTGREWSPETLLTGAIASCYVLGFRAIAAASKLGWHSIECSVGGTLDRVGNVMKFTTVSLSVRLTVPDARNAERSARILEKAKENCLVTNSLSAAVTLETRVEIAA